MQHYTERYVIPPRSPYSLIQEDIWQPNKESEWLMLIVCMMLNCTKRVQVEKILPNFISKWPNPTKFLLADDNDVFNVCRSLGFANRRTTLMKKMTLSFVHDDWEHVKDLPGIGEYASRSWEIFYRNTLGNTPPKDHALVQYWLWRINEKTKRTDQTHQTTQINEV